MAPKNEAKTAEIVPRGTEATREVAMTEGFKEQSQQLETLILKAIEKDVAPETMEKFLAMRRELKAEWMKEQFDNAMALAQAEFPIIKKTSIARNAEGKELYRYAGIDAIISQTKGIIAKYGLSYSFKTVNLPDKVTVSCIAKHKSGHSEESTMETALATKTNIMSSPQQTAATFTFNKRYAFCNVFGITTGDEDKEEALQGDEAFESEMEKAKKALEAVKSPEELKKVWATLSKAIKGNREIITYANEVKTKLSA